MSKSAKLIITLVIGGLILAAILFLMFSGGMAITIKIPQATIQQQIDAKLPIDKSRGPIHYQIHDARIAFKADGRVVVAVTAEAGIGSHQLVARVLGSGDLTYENGSFFFRSFDAEPDDISLHFAGQKPHDRPPGHEKLAAEIKTATVELLRLALDRVPVYRLKPEDTKQAVAKLVLRGIQSGDGVLTITLWPQKTESRP